MPRPVERTLAKRIVDRLAVDGGDRIFRDREVPGFGVRVYPSGRKVFVIQARGPLRRRQEGVAGQAWRTRPEPGAAAGDRA